MYVQSLVVELCSVLNTQLTKNWISYGYFSVCVRLCFHIYVLICVTASCLIVMSWSCVFHQTLCRVRGYLCDEKPTWGWLDTRPQLFIRPPTFFFFFCFFSPSVCVCVSVCLRIFQEKWSSVAPLWALTCEWHQASGHSVSVCSATSTGTSISSN